METFDPNSSPNKRLKTETLTLDSPINPSTKGKSPINPLDEYDDEIPAQLQPQNCGICFSDQGKSVRGLIDSCDHYFCFLCIIEWSKIDSRCPLCRGRFSSIRRVRKDGTFIGTGSVPVPVRDQIYDAFGESVDPYGQAKCSVCDGAKDECLLLLCDLCDSASHTYCVGLGATVPEDDWYCHDCDLLRAEQSDCGMDDNEDTTAIPKKANERESVHINDSETTTTVSANELESVHINDSETTTTVSIFDIVRDPSEPRRANSGTDRLLELVSLNPTKFSSSAIVSDHPSSSSASDRSGTRSKLISVTNDRGSSVRTLRKCRDVHKNLSVLRENWDAFRAGSLSFSTQLTPPSGKICQKTVEKDMSKKQSLVSQSAKSSQSQTQEVSCGVTQKDQSYNVQRAWKLMNAAKSVQPVNKAKSYSKTASDSIQDLKVDDKVSKCFFSGKKDLICSRMGTHSPKNVNGNLVRSSEGRQFSSFDSTAASASRNEYRKSYPATKVVTMVQADIYGNKPCGKLGGGESSSFADETACSTSSHGPIRGRPDGVYCTDSQRQRISTLPVKQVKNLNISLDNRDAAQSYFKAGLCYDGANLGSHANRASCSSKISDDCHMSDRPANLKEIVAGGSNLSSTKQKKEVSENPRKKGAKLSNKACKGDDEAKGEILSLVKLNLKLLSKEKCLDSDMFKEIARLSTHTILASCGFEHRDIVRSIPRLVCHHANQIQHLSRPALVPSSCRDCFYTFVKDVVNSILSEKMNNDTFAC